MSIAVWRIGSTKGLTLSTLWLGSTFESGRWHRTPPEGQPVVYAGGTRALCQLEKRVHCNGVQPLNQALLRLDLPDDAVLMDIREAGLPDNWRADELWTQSAGITWRASGASLGLWVPSAVEPDESNILLNPDHPQYAAVTITVERNPFRFDKRMF
ncbi:RES family NAD+ phosphorylase [Variovorax sp. LjRoot84]|uniref:RES family NAD+ phosphorylase n=1 Tax=Variovorax sp. LjRoot84 TaxID=3342340 RepID=UPI003ECFE7B9